jgi:hypothetical protein
MEDGKQKVLIFTVLQIPKETCFYVNVPNCLPGNKSLNIQITIEHWYSDNKNGNKLHGEKLFQCPYDNYRFRKDWPGIEPLVAAVTGHRLIAILKTETAYKTSVHTLQTPRVTGLFLGPCIFDNIEK